MKDNIIYKKEDYKDIELNGFDYKLFEEKEGGGTKEGLYRYTYLKHLIQLRPCDWVKYMEKMIEAVVINNRFTMDWGWKRLVSPFKRQKFCKCIGCVISAVTYGKK